MSDSVLPQYLQFNDKKSSRVGEQYQINDNMLQQHNVKHDDNNDINDTSYDGTLLYSYKNIKSYDKLEYYLNTIKSYFCDCPELYDGELALQLLHSNDYNIDNTIQLCQPIDNLPKLLDVSDDSISDDDIDSMSRGSDIDDINDSDDLCTICGEGGEVIICDHSNCTRVYHILCAGLKELPTGDWYCSAHFCIVCNTHIQNDSPYVCHNCPTAYCIYHIPRDQTTVINNNNNNDHNFLCLRCRAQDEISSALHERHTFLRQLMSILQQPTHPQLYSLYQHINDIGGIEFVVERNGWVKLVDYVQNIVNPKHDSHDHNIQQHNVLNNNITKIET